MNIINTDFPEVKVIQPKVFGDNRGWFMETYNKKKIRRRRFGN